MSHHCALCGNISFRYYYEYERHRLEMHSLKTEIKPERVTGRSPRQIVDDAERTWLKPYLIQNTTVILANDDRRHLDACRCMECFNHKLDTLIASQEEALNNQEEPTHAS